MTGNDIIEMIQNNNWEDADCFISVDGTAKSIEVIAPLFPRLANTNDIVLSEGEDVIYDDDFWIRYYGSYMNIITVAQADEEFHNGTPFYVLYCDGTEAQIDSSMSEEEWENLKDSGVMFGHES